MGVVLCITQLVCRDRALRPIRALVAFVHLHVEEFFQQVAESDLLATQDACRDHRIENIGERKLIIALEAHYIVFGSVKDFLDLRISQNMSEYAQVFDRQWIDHEILLPRRDLNQADLLAIRVQAVRFSIDGIHSDCAQVKRIQGLRMKQGIKKFYVGEDRFPSIAPAKAEFHTIRVEIPVGFGAEFMKWHSAGKDRTTSSGLERNGAIEFLAPGSRKSYFSLNLSGMGISSIAKSAHALNIDLFVQGMRLTPGGAAVK